MRNFLDTSNVVEITEKRLNDIPKFLGYFIKINDSSSPHRFKFLINLESYDVFTTLSTIYLAIKNNAPFYKNCNFYINIGDKILSKKEIDVLKKFAQMLEIDGINLEFREYGAIWSSHEVFSTYDYLESEIQKVKNLNLSPFETFLCYYHQLTNRIYNQESQTENSLLSRSIIGINNSDRIVCAGYAHWLTALIERSDIKDMWAMPTTLEMFRNNQR